MCWRVIATAARISKPLCFVLYMYSSLKANRAGFVMFFFVFFTYLAPFQDTELLDNMCVEVAVLGSFSRLI